MTITIQSVNPSNRREHFKRHLRLSSGMKRDGREGFLRRVPNATYLNPQLELHLQNFPSCPIAHLSEELPYAP